MKAKVWIALGAEFFIFAALLFGSAGTLSWRAAWAFLVLFFGAALLITRKLAQDEPGLLDERLKLPFQQGQPIWDKIFLAGFIVYFFAWLPLMGLDAVRFGWSVMPEWVPWIAADGVAIALWISFRTLQANPFAASVVRIQTERGHRVISSGPYAYVRHPLYASALLLLPSIALMLGSWAGLVATIPLIGALIARTVLEDRELHQSLFGYDSYARRVRFRLLPFIW
ncbi:isoprenylcysteine carboxylmethyltransferase family protein [Methylocapsa polymorpha]|uniref:Isoprenylcysteine carboxylmethyltransferase family protein n=1 Tax=Methylocapsa polymorpha TaxID=3080828 RepID=A0ABZ0HXM8_9HYPH|nr:isoprenylcysteine carboxylmethyltransferase family protein [Methylocapsa sp. RX1]